MAEACLQLLLDNLFSLIKEEVGLIMGVEQEMNKLSSNLTAIQAVLEDAQRQQLESKQIRDWLCKLNDLTYEIEDILDECATEISKLKHNKSSKSSPNFGLKKILYRRKIGRRMKQVTGKLDMIAAEREKFHLREMGIERKSNYAATRETSSILNESEHIFGRDEEKEEIVDILVNQMQDCEQLSVLPIIGVGGLGKTTLARMVFNDTKVEEHFDLKIWVCVSDDFDLKTLIKAMIESATCKGTCSDLTSLDALQCRLRELLNPKRFLLVLDDVWNDDQEKWCKLKNAVAFGSKGSTVVVTTRLKKVADIMGTLPAHHLSGLSDENCWLLFKDRAFGQEKEEHPNLEPIGKKIVKKCGGVPLAAKALGGLLRFKRTEKEWLHILESEIWNLPQEESLLLPALQLSYHHLPLELRRCFAYCAVFPKDSLIEKEEVIFLWMAHGYISSNGILEEEDIGNEIWNELVLRSLFQDVREDYYRGKTTFTMHDLVHDLAQSLMENKVPGVQGRHFNDHKSASKGKIRQVNLRNHRVAFPCSIRVEIDLSFCLMNLNGLRTLDASFRRIDNMPSAIGNLKHLRYLNLSWTGIRTLPNAICSLWNLKILKLNGCYDLVGLPEQTRFLRNLRHLLLEDCGELKEMPPKIGELSSLKTLSMFVVGSGKGASRLGELQFLNIGGKLEIRHLERLEKHEDAKMANLHEKENLGELILRWELEDETFGTEKILDEKVLQALEPHPNMKTIKIHGFRGRYFPQWSSLVNLVEFELVNCRNCLRLPELGKLPHLKIMYLRDVGVEYIIMEDEIIMEYGICSKLFPSLEQLKLNDLQNLKGFSKEKVTEISIFPRLQNLDIYRCCSSLILPQLPSLKELTGCRGNNLTSLGRPDLLTSLLIHDGDIPDEVLENLTSLESLYIDEKSDLESSDSRKRLTCLPHGWSPHLASLKELWIGNCQEFVELPEDIRYLKSLTEIWLHDLPKMVSLPESLKHIPSPFTLWLHGLPELTKILAVCSTCISELRIWSCPKLTSLPDTIKEMKHLKYLSIRGCPELERRCEKEKGEDWHKIAHIPTLTIGSTYWVNEE
ncbi:putative disease resistance protein RGA4 [Henckelia pumila]|uniref:putative disease resistance protein RGA4 n=1 Tax=Henckelia pumila TaxID=405737 RepID=UPI003C6E0D40